MPIAGFQILFSDPAVLWNDSEKSTAMFLEQAFAIIRCVCVEEFPAKAVRGVPNLRLFPIGACQKSGYPKVGFRPFSGSIDQPEMESGSN